MKVRVAPHTFFFLLLTFSYGIPVILTLFYNINEEYTYVNDNILAEYSHTAWTLLSIYAIATVSFLLGSKLTHDSIKRVRVSSISQDLISNSSSSLPLNFWQKNVIYGFICLGLVMLFKMFRAGTFSSDYIESFGAGFESQNVYTMLCDVFFFFFLYLCLNYQNSYNKSKLLLLVMIFVTLLRGSRMFTIPLIFFLLYKMVYIDGLTRKKIGFILLGGTVVLLGLCLVFFLRHGASFENVDILGMIFLLIQYESCGVHVPLMKEIMMGWHLSFAPMFTYVTDTFLFVIPRIVFPEKNEYLFFDRVVSEYNLSPFGGINGEASVILYFGMLFPFFFFLVGGFLSYLYNLVKKSSNTSIKVLYTFICCSLMFTFLRNGILIATKSMIVVWIILAFFVFVRRISLNLKG